jgi:hypothetical protein
MNYEIDWRGRHLEEMQKNRSLEKELKKLKDRNDELENRFLVIGKILKTGECEIGVIFNNKNKKENGL